MAAELLVSPVYRAAGAAAGERCRVSVRSGRISREPPQCSRGRVQNSRKRPWLTTTFALPVLALLALAPLAAGCSEAPAGEHADVRAPVLAPAARGAALCVDTARSIIRWRGTKFGGRGKHEGVVRLASGRLVLRDSTVVGGDVVVDMHTIEITDMPKHETIARRQLRGHLEHEEFFGVERFPTASFVITDVVGGEHGIYTISGNLAVRDSVHNITFDATAPLITPDDVWATARFSIDRHLWGVNYDGTISRLRDDLVDDDIHLELTLVASSATAGCGPGPKERGEMAHRLTTNPVVVNK